MPSVDIDLAAVLVAALINMVVGAKWPGILVQNRSRNAK